MDINYTSFFAARFTSGLSRESVSDSCGLSIKRISNLEKGLGNQPTIEEIMLLEEIYHNNIIKNYFIEILNTGGLYQIMPRKVKKSSKLQKYIALNEAIMYNTQIATVLDCSTATAIIEKRKLNEIALLKKNIALPPNGGIQTKIFNEVFLIFKEDFIHDPDVIDFINNKEERL